MYEAMGAPVAFPSLATRVPAMTEREQTSVRAVDVGRNAGAALATRKRAAIELIRSHERALRRTARRYSICADDGEDAMQRAFEILLTKAPTSDQRELIRWMQTVTKHEALAVRRNRERTLGPPASSGRDTDSDWVQLIPSEKDGPYDEAERRERIARAREALKALKPQELRALTLLAHGYSYAEIAEITDWTFTNARLVTAPLAMSPFLTKFLPGRAPAVVVSATNKVIMLRTSEVEGRLDASRFMGVSLPARESGCRRI
jgi:RNA polymerase sigma factor (sigma-70 family)